jgi:hypothetical protein
MPRITIGGSSQPGADEALVLGGRARSAVAPAVCRSPRRLDAAGDLTGSPAGLACFGPAIRQSGHRLPLR